MNWSGRGSWLDSDESFTWIRSLALKNRIVAIDLNIQDTDRCQKIAKAFHERFIQIDTLYVSNICGYMFEKEEKKRSSLRYALSLSPKPP